MRSLSSAFSMTHHRAGVVAVGCVATAALVLTGCSTTHQNQHPGGHGHSGGQGHVTVGQAIALAAKRAAKLTSLTVVETMTMHGIPLPSGGGLVPGPGAG